MANKITAWNERKAILLKDKCKPYIKRLNKVIAEVATTKERANVYWSKLQAEVKKIYRGVQKVCKDWTNIFIPIGFRAAARQSIYKIKNNSITRTKKIKALDTIILPNDFNYTTFINKDIVKQATQSLTEETLTAFVTGLLSGEKLIIKLLRNTQQINIKEYQINEAIKNGYIEKGTIQESIKQLQRQLLSAATEGKYITIINKNGAEMHFQIDTYAELVARTKLQEASAQAVLNTASVAGSDLVQVSAHNTPTKICIPFEGKIFSITGNNKDFPKLSESPPYHPNCLHTLTVVFEEGLQADDTYDKYSAFSKGETGQHPTRKGWIPVSQRTIK